MAFWALGQVKNITNKMSSTLKTYVANPTDKNHQPQTTEQILSDAELMEIQLYEYKKLNALQEQLMKEFQQQRQNQYVMKEQELSQNLNQLQQELKEQQKIKCEVSMIEEVESGKKELKSIIRENLVMREKLEESR